MLFRKELLVLSHTKLMNMTKCGYLNVTAVRACSNHTDLEA